MGDMEEALDSFLKELEKMGIKAKVTVTIELRNLNRPSKPTS